MKIRDRRDWANLVLSQLESVCDVKNDHFTFLAGMKYREILVSHMTLVDIPLEGFPIGKQLQNLIELIK